MTATPLVVSTEAKCAIQFLETLPDPRRSPWVDRFEVWAREHDLGAAETKAVKIAILKLRAFGLGGARRHRR